MGKPIGTKPSKDEIISRIEDSLTEPYISGPITCTESKSQLLIFQSEQEPVQIDLNPIGGEWNKKYTGIDCRVYEIPPDKESYSKQFKTHFHIHNGKTWDELISDFIFTLSGAIHSTVKNIENKDNKS